MFEGFYSTLEQLGIMPVVMLENVEDAAPLAHALVAGGLPAAEVTFRTPCAAACIDAMREAEPQMCVGAGTVTDIAQADEALRRGAQFIVSPGLSTPVVAHILEAGIPALPGTVTPSEVMAAEALGLYVTKFFPAAQFGGLGTITALSAPFRRHRFMPTGGISPHNVRDYLACPAVIACGGTWMVKPQLFADGDFSRVEQLAREAAALREP